MENKYYKEAFTLLELVIVIIVVGIMAAIAIPRIDRRVMIEVSNQVATHIRYAQHLAMIDDKFDPTNPNWHYNRWSIRFNRISNQWRYSICFNSTGLGGCNSPVAIATDPKNPRKFLSGGTEAALTDEQLNNDLNLQRKFDITNVAIAGGCNNQQIAFDKKGRPYCYPTNLGGLTNPGSGLIANDVNITLTNSAGQNAIITIYAQTGFVEITALP